MLALAPFPILRRLELSAWPVPELHEFELIYWFRRWLREEYFEGCAEVRDELARREATGQLRIGLLVDGFRDKHTGAVVFTGMSTLLDAWPDRYPHLFTRRAAEAWLNAQVLDVASAG